MPTKTGLESLVREYLEATRARDPVAGMPELEVRFGGARGFKRLSGADTDRVSARLRSLDFSVASTAHILRISTQRERSAPLRTEIQGLRDISRYCDTNKIREESQATFEEKGSWKRGLGPEDNDALEFRVSLQREKRLPSSSRQVKAAMANWNQSEKYFRCMNRTSLESKQFPVRVDISVVQSAKGTSITESGLLSRPTSYEVEIEVDSTRVGTGTKYSTPAELTASLRRVITYVLQGLQGTNYPVGKGIRNRVLGEYAALIGAKFTPGRPLRNWAFVGPSSVTLQVDNIAPPNPASELPNIRAGYTVTDKADGERKMLYIGEGKKGYFITTNMEAQFTGTVFPGIEVGTLLDGEHIIRDKSGKYINLYAAFDAYWVDKKSIRDLPFVAVSGKESRLLSLRTVVKGANGQGPVSDRPAPLRLSVKLFEVADGPTTIFKACGEIMRRERDGLYEYETDGLIFTPASLAVGATEIGKPAAPAKKTTWIQSFKWKPPEQNTIDFLVVLKKATGSSQDVISNMFQSGTDASAATQLSQYKTAILCVGHDIRNKDANPCQEMLEGAGSDISIKQVVAPGLRAEDTYKPTRFFPTQPYDPQAGECNMMLSPGVDGNSVMLAESGEVIEDQSIVEFRYDPERDASWRWVPLRVRHDKTADLRGGGRNYGNDERVANSNWKSLHNPVTDKMLKTGEGIPDGLADDDVYYNRSTRTSQTRGLRDFHNRYVKNTLIVGLSKPGGTIIDLAVGKAGDLSKWTDARASFVMGVDLARDNIYNAKDGACARYVQYKKKMKTVPRAVFLQGNSSRNVRNGEAFGTQKAKTRAAAIFGKGPKSKSRLEEMVYESYGDGEKGFGLCSMQFALHYVWGTPQELQGFMRNVSETTEVGGHFIATCFDGEEIFRLLARKKEGESVMYTADGNKMWEVTKRYDRSTYDPDSSCLGYAIDIYQDTINKTFKEYLVNPTYLTRVMENYGFAPLTEVEAKGAGLPASQGSFRALFAQMERQIAKKPALARRYGAASSMTPTEKKVSFLNRYFVYKKVRSVDAEQVMYGLLGNSMTDQARKQEQKVEDAAVSSVRKASGVPAASGVSAASGRPTVASGVSAASGVPTAAASVATASGTPKPGRMKSTGRKLKLKLVSK